MNGGSLSPSTCVIYTQNKYKRYQTLMFLHSDVSLKNIVKQKKLQWGVFICFRWRMLYQRRANYNHNWGIYDNRSDENHHLWTSEIKLLYMCFSSRSRRSNVHLMHGSNSCLYCFSSHHFYNSTLGCSLSQVYTGGDQHALLAEFR